jgi:hypothetical protein
MAYVNLAIAGMSAFNSIQQGRYAQAQAGMQAQVGEIHAQMAQEDALQTAEIIRKAGRKAVSSATAAYAGAGVKVGEGSAAQTGRQIDNDVEHDEYVALLEGNRRASGLRLDAALGRSQGDAAQAAGNVGAVTALMGGFNTGLRATGWRTGGMPGYAGTQAPAPIENRDIPRG